ncbi:MAG: hypothetical protein HC896_13000 [Bacteroidales bacterium]|nr:hypothetical protein [Bacteroidales bacterium]
MAALLISLSILYKYIPIFILPVLGITNRKINWKFSLSAFAFLTAGFGASYYFWGVKMLNPFLVNAGRESKILSIFRYFRGEYSFLKFFGVENIDFLSTYFVVGAVLTVFVLHVIYQWHYLHSLIITLLAVFLFYKVGHFQFYISVYFILFFYLAKSRQTIGEEVITRKKVFQFLYWLAGITILYGATEGFYRKFSVIREFISVPHTIMLAILLVAFVKQACQSRNKIAFG